MSEELIEVFVPIFERAQKLGILGKKFDILSGIEHSVAFNELLNHPSKLDASISCLDIGSGSGLPGLVLAYKDQNIEQKLWTLCERSQKRADFLKWAIEILKLKTQVLTKSVDLVDEQYDCITVRAFAPLKITVEIILNLLKLEGTAIISTNSRINRKSKELTNDSLVNFGLTIELINEPYSFAVLKKVMDIPIPKRSIKAMKKALI